MRTHYANGEEKTTSMLCDTCEALTVNGIICHEHGCPSAWKDEKHVCKWCGSHFTPDDPHQQFCDESCAESYYS